MKIFLQNKYADYLILLVIIIIGYWQLFFFNAIMKWDALDITFPWKFYATECLKNKTLPLWNPFYRNGFAQMGESSNWYPISFIIGCLKRYDLTSLHFEYMLHIYIAGLGMYKLASYFDYARPTKLLLATTYMLSGFFIGNAQHLGWIVSAAWLPFIFYYFLVLRSNPSTNNSLLLSIFLFLCLSGGYPGIFIVLVYSLFFLGLYFLILWIKQNNIKGIKRGLSYLSISVVTFFLMSAVVLNASFDVAQFISRGGGLDGSSALLSVTEGSLPIKALLTLFFPFIASLNSFDFWGEDFSLVNIYIGILPLILFGVFFFLKKTPLKIKWLLIASILYLCMGITAIFPFREWAVVFPFMNMFRFPALFRIFFILNFLLVIGYAFEQLSKNEKLKPILIKIIIVGFFAVVAAQIYLFFQISSWNISSFNFTNNYSSISITERAFWSGIFVLGILISIIASLKIFSFRKALKVIVVISIIDLVVVLQLNGSGTVYEKYDTQKINKNIAQIPKGYPIPSLLKSISNITDASLQNNIPFLWRNLGMIYKIPSSSGYGPYQFSLQQQAIDEGLNHIINNPLLFLAREINNELLDTNSIDTHSSSKIAITSFSPNKITATINNSENTNLIFLQNYYPYWVASINGNITPIKKVNKAYMTIELPKGNNNVFFSFQPAIIISLYVSVISFIIISLFLIISFIQKNKSERNYLSTYLFFVIIVGGGYFLMGMTAPEETSNIHYTPYSNYDCELANPDWSNAYLTDSISYKGKYCNQLNAVYVYSSTFKKSYKEFLKNKKAIKIEAFVKYEKLADPQFVFQVDRNGKNMYWKNFKILRNDTLSSTNNWEKAEWKVDLTEMELENEDIISIYIWNEKKKNIWADDFSVSIK